MSECYPNGPPAYPPDGTYEVAIDVYIRSAATGEVRVYHDKGLCDTVDDRFWDYIWEEGNFSCDCNRGSFFANDGKPSEDYKWAGKECGQSAYIVEKIVRLDTGAIVYKDDT